MRKLTILLIFTLALFTTALATTPTSYVVIPGDTMWKIASKHQVGTSELISANPQISNPNLIYPGQVLSIPSLDSTVSSYEVEVIRLVNFENLFFKQV